MYTVSHGRTGVCKCSSNNSSSKKIMEKTDKYTDKGSLASWHLVKITRVFFTLFPASLRLQKFKKAVGKQVVSQKKRSPQIKEKKKNT